MSLSEGEGGEKKFPSFLKRDRIAEDLRTLTAGQRGSSCGAEETHCTHADTHEREKFKNSIKICFL